MADTLASCKSKRAEGHIYMGGYVTRIVRRLNVFGADVETSMTARYRLERNGRATMTTMRIAVDIPRVDFRFCLQRERLEDLAAWQFDVLIAVATHLAVQILPLPQPRQYPDDDVAGGGAGGGVGVA
ncbi:hypothetical protein E3N88_35094 [Mikania micrantha]|uniref:Uncharacterized protein n=1 Tax=Mikania micrantha TaxID=192012 RepID=A0A5N6M000_9ASTR|nr:hypothetical protein E3N88_35094 [Mikania micrantha]